MVNVVKTSLKMPKR